MFKASQAWNAFHLVSTNFLENVGAENYKKLVKDTLMQYPKLGSNMSLKIHFLHSHLDFFSDNCGMVSHEHDECFVNITKLWNKDTMESPLQCWLTTTAGHSRDVPKQLYSR